MLCPTLAPENAEFRRGVTERVEPHRRPVPIVTIGRMHASQFAVREYVDLSE